MKIIDTLLESLRLDLAAARRQAEINEACDYDSALPCCVVDDDYSVGLALDGAAAWRVLPLDRWRYPHRLTRDRALALARQLGDEWRVVLAEDLPRLQVPVLEDSIRLLESITLD